MKTVYLVRHAKSSWKDMSLKDIDRPLNKRGKRDAPFMGNLLKEQGVMPDILISSPANRAYTTACHFAEAFGLSKEEVVQEPRIYEAWGSEILDIIRQQTDDRTTIFLFGHNPTFTSVANSFTDNYIDNVPTCGIVRIDAEIELWEDFSYQTGRVISFQFPKQHFSA